ncbi:MAG: hypothetical protein ACF788_05505, partial [Novipirellula sp. JB048]
MPRSAVTLVGASVRAAAESAARAGLRVIGVDAFGDRDARAACDHFVLLSGTGCPESALAAASLDLAAAGSIAAGSPPPRLRVGGFARDSPQVRQLCDAAPASLTQPCFLAQLAN